MKKIFELPVVEAKNLTLQNEIMGIFSSGNSTPAQTSITYIDDTVTVEQDDSYNYWRTK